MSQRHDTLSNDAVLETLDARGSLLVCLHTKHRHESIGSIHGPQSAAYQIYSKTLHRSSAIHRAQLQKGLSKIKDLKKAHRCGAVKLCGYASRINTVQMNIIPFA